MVTDEPVQPGGAATAEAKAYLRVEGAHEDPLIARLVASALALCEAFTGQALLRRDFQELLTRSSAWQRLGRMPVSAVTSFEEVRPDGSYAALGAGSYAVDIDSNGDGWVRVTASGSGRIRVAYQAGLAADWNTIPEALRQGILRLAAHLYAHRTASDEAEPPAAVTALWRPWRRMRIG